MPTLQSGQVATSPQAKLWIARVLNAAREHFAMEAAFVYLYRGALCACLQVDSEPDGDWPSAGEIADQPDFAKTRLVQGKLSAPLSQRLGSLLGQSRSINMGCLISVPLMSPSGQQIGFMIAVHTNPNPSLCSADLDLMACFAGIVGYHLNQDRLAANEIKTKRRRLQEIIETGAFLTVFQPIWHLTKHRVIGFECLTRFDQKPLRSPDKWFNEADALGLRLKLELATLKACLAASADLVHAYTFINASPALVMSTAFHDLMAKVDCSRFVLEIANLSPIDDPERFATAIARLCERGLQFAVDDADANLDDLQLTHRLTPSAIKLDKGLTRNIDKELEKQAAVESLVHYAQKNGVDLIAEGIETVDELHTLKALGVERGQGFLLGRPVGLALALDLTRSEGAFDRLLAVRAA